MSRSKIPEPEIKKLWAASGGVCAFPDCDARLVRTEQDTAATSVVGEQAHIVADKRQGPRGRHEMSEDDRNKHTNLVLLCHDHHKIVDDHPEIYSIPVLRQIKIDHEKQIHESTGGVRPTESLQLSTEKIHSSLLAITHLPQAVFAADTDFRPGQEGELAKEIKFPPSGSSECIAYVLHDKKLYSFHDLAQYRGPFARVVDRKSAYPIQCQSFWESIERRRLLVRLLNKSLSNCLGGRRVRYDRDHRRHYFLPIEAGQARQEKYRTMNGLMRPMDVVWQPKKRSTGEARNYWWHRAASFRFNYAGDGQWFLSMRPERHLTKDSVQPLPSDWIGRRVTRVKAKMFNDKYLAELHFWRDFLARGEPRFILDFGRQSAIIESTLMTVEVTSPGIPDDVKRFDNQEFEEDLFSWAGRENATHGHSIDWDEWNEEEPDI